MLPVTGLDHVGLKARDLGKTLDFYTRLGLTVLRTSGPHADGVRSAVLRVGEQELNVFAHPDFAAEPSANGCGMAGCGWSSRSRRASDATRRRARAARARLDRVRVAAIQRARSRGSVPALTGMFTYMAVAAIIALCGESERLPVTMEADYKALEAAYLKERPQLGQAILVSVEGRIEPRPSAEESQPPRPSLVVERFVGIWPREMCGNPRVDSPLRNTDWKVVRLNGVPVRVAARQREPYLTLARDEQRVSGDGGCNRFTGGFELNGARLRFRGMAGTMMACLDGMEQEGYLLQALQKVERYRISGSHLEMLDASGAVVARFEAFAPR